MHTLSDVERDLLTVVAGFVDNEVAPAAAAHERDSTFPRETFRRLGQMDLLGLTMPEEVGGSGLGLRTYLLVLEELARGHATLALAVSVHTLVMQAIAHGGTDEQVARFLPPMVSGERLGAFCLSEPDAGSDAASLRARARRDDDGTWRLSGTKAWVTHGGIADTHVVFARTGGDGASGISAFLVDGDQVGMTVDKHEDKMGLRGSPTAQLAFDDAPVPADRLLGAEGRGFATAMAGLDKGRLGIAALSTGVAQASLDAALGYARHREQFGTPIVEFQGVAFLLADMATGIEASRCLYKDAAGRLDAGYDASKAASMAKLFCTDTAMRVTTDAVQVHGGIGYTRDVPVERYMREVKVMQIFEGTNQIQRLVIGRRLAAGS